MSQADSSVPATCPCWVAPPKFSRQVATLALARKAASDKQHILHNATTAEVPGSRLKSRQPYNLAAQGLICSTPDHLPHLPHLPHRAWLTASWRYIWQTFRPTQLHSYIWDLGGGVKGNNLPRHWTTLNRL